MLFFSNSKAAQNASFLSAYSTNIFDSFDINYPPLAKYFLKANNSPMVATALSILLLPSKHKVINFGKW